MPLSHWGDHAELPPLPPKEEWGSTDEFKTTTKNGKPRCQSFSRNFLRQGKRGADAQCKKVAIEGTKRCYSHTYKMVKVAAPKTLREELTRYRKHMPQHFLKRVIDAASDTKRLELAEEIDILTGRIGELIERVDSRQSKYAWDKISDAYSILKSAISAGDAESLKLGMAILKEAISQSDYPVWHEIIHAIHDRRIMVESERRRIVETAQVISITEFMGAIARIQADLFDTFPETADRQKITQKFMAFAVPDLFVMPSAMTDPLENKVRNPPWFETHAGRKHPGCIACRNDEYRERNYNDEGFFQCPNCNEVWKRPLMIEAQAQEVKDEASKGTA